MHNYKIISNFLYFFWKIINLKNIFLAVVLHSIHRLIAILPLGKHNPQVHVGGLRGVAREVSRFALSSLEVKIKAHHHHWTKRHPEWGEKLQRGEIRNYLGNAINSDVYFYTLAYFPCVVSWGRGGTINTDLFLWLESRLHREHGPN